MKIPNIAVPAAPIPVHTAYAIPIGILFNVLARQVKLNAPKKIKRRIGFSLVKPSEYFNEIANAISKSPAIINRSQYIRLNINNILIIFSEYKIIPITYYLQSSEENSLCLLA